jgi:6-phosphogluconolactonase
MQHEISIYPDASFLTRALAAKVLRVGAEAAKRRGRFSIAISGGSALTLLADGLLAGAPETPVDWSAWHVFWADERCVPEDSPDNNHAAARKAWLDRVPIPPGQLHAVAGERAPADAALDYERQLREYFCLAPGEWPKFDLILLGIGADGHTASLFPGLPAIHEETRLAVPVLQAPKPPSARVSLTLPVLNQARHLWVVATGADKAAVLARVLAPDGRDPELPAQRLRPAAGDLCWLLDRAAAGHLSASHPSPCIPAEAQP